MSGGIGSPLSVRSFQNGRNERTPTSCPEDSDSVDDGSFPSAGSPMSGRTTSQNRRPSYSSVTSRDAEAGSADHATTQARLQVCPSDEEDIMDDDNSDDDHQSSPWSEIIGKYLRGTTRGQILEYGKLIRPHTCHKTHKANKCKFKRVSRSYRLCTKHHRPYFECRSYRRHSRTNNNAPQPMQGEGGGGAAAAATAAAFQPMVDPLSLVPIQNPTTLVATQPVFVLPAAAAATAAAGGPYTPAGSANYFASHVSQNRLPHPPLYCHDSGLWASQDASGAHQAGFAIGAYPTAYAAPATAPQFNPGIKQRSSSGGGPLPPNPLQKRSDAIQVRKSLAVIFRFLKKKFKKFAICRHFEKFQRL